ncbi:MAG: hypothetical protein ACK4RS_04080 [Thiothrix sp.]
MDTATEQLHAAMAESLRGQYYPDGGTPPLAHNTPSRSHFCA